ncbi:hypothetical protein GWI33_020314 [Rhynchophorus ferrugineus]|uniref:Uncharacterized protein n=1 Tax=Rhynchophorus ferrugineus TaxID=354439 RepID=A0A834M3F8_RHYFE|nr:hypothetical protein GWI33_020314 [Rhynchophorus ferrugineus]
MTPYVAFVVLVGGIVFSGCFGYDQRYGNIVANFLSECSNSSDSYICLSEKATRIFENSINRTLNISNGIELVRNQLKLPNRQSRTLKSGERLKAALTNFLKTHNISIKLSEFTGRRSGGIGGNFINRKQLRRERKYMNYAFMVLLGIFGLTGPLVMKVLGLIAAQALISAKAAMIIVGSVALKKIFEKDKSHGQPSVKVHTIGHNHDDEYDRISRHGYIRYSYGGDDATYNNYEDYYGSNADGYKVT